MNRRLILTLAPALLLAGLFAGGRRWRSRRSQTRQR